MTRSFLLGLLLAPLAVPCVGANSRGPFPIFGASRSICINIPWQVRSIVEPSYPLQVDTLRAVHRFRGGAEDVADDDDDDDDEESDYEDEDDGDFSKFADVTEDDDFAEETWIDRTIQAYHKTPPFTKAYLTASFVAASTSFLLGQKDFPSALVLDWGKVVSKFQIWRPFTAFLNFGPLGLGYAMTVNFVWVYMSTLERLCHNAPYDFWIMIAFGMFSMLVGYPIMGLNGRFLGHNISTYLVYIWSRYHEGAVVSMFDLFTTRAELLPWFFLAQVCETGTHERWSPTLVYDVHANDS